LSKAEITIEKMVRLCSTNPLRSWLKEKWKSTKNDYVYSTKDGIYVLSKPAKDNDLIWLPVGFNIKTGHWQICDLIWEAFKRGNSTILAKLYEVKDIVSRKESQWL